VPGDINREPDVIFVESPPVVVDKMLKLANVKKDDVVYDLGCGDGRIVVAADRKYGCKAVGVDIDLRQVQDALDNVRKNDVGDLVTIRHQDMFAADLSKATVVALLPSVNLKLVPQFQKMKPGSRIVSHAFGIEGYKPRKEVIVKDKTGEHKVYLCVTPLEKG
jgi:ribosomal protein L11 methylase PrmA